MYSGRESPGSGSLDAFIRPLASTVASLAQFAAGVLANMAVRRADTP